MTVCKNCEHIIYEGDKGYFHIFSCIHGTCKCNLCYKGCWTPEPKEDE